MKKEKRRNEKLAKSDRRMMRKIESKKLNYTREFRSEELPISFSLKKNNSFCGGATATLAALL